ncbi:MAG: hypothetical protein K2M17_05745 [Bacilli bacterium]|nr:hypothetical protein [Bacilli bacterium]
MATKNNVKEIDEKSVVVENATVTETATVETSTAEVVTEATAPTVPMASTEKPKKSETKKTSKKKEASEKKGAIKEAEAKLKKDVKKSTTKKEAKKEVDEKPKKEAKKKKSEKAATPTTEKEAKVKKSEPKAKKSATSQPVAITTEEPTMQPIIKTPKEGSIASLIINAANSKYPYRNEKGITMIDNKTRRKLTDDEYKEVARHRDICRELVRLSTENHNFPYAVLVYIAIGTDAHKKPVFERGYKAINVEKAETIIRWLEAFAKYNENPKFFTSDKIVHAFAKFYDTFSKKDKDFNKGMRSFVKQPAIMGYKPSQYKNMEQFYSLFFKPFLACVKVDEKTGKETAVSVTMKPQSRRGRKPKNANIDVAKAS